MFDKIKALVVNPPQPETCTANLRASKLNTEKGHGRV
jgi:hypothetical protein